MGESIIHLDKQLLIFLNNLGSSFWDPFWLAITNQRNWIPLFLFVFYLVIKTFGWKKGGLLILSMILLVAFSDQFTNLIKNSVMRLRPNNDTAINHLLRRHINPQSFSFISGHATTSTAFATFTFFLLKKQYKNIRFIVLFPLIFAYSRLYLGVHFPMDILAGMLTGFFIGIGFYRLVKFIEKKATS